jgi:hypothetical protein
VHCPAVDGEWGVEISYATVDAVILTQADVGPLSVYNVLIGYGVKC